MKLIDRLLIGSFLKMFLGTLMVLLTLFELISFFDLIDDFVQHKADATLVIFYFILRLPEAVLNMAPMAVLIGAILTFSLISRSREVIIMMGAGLSVWRIAAPVLGAALVISMLNFMNGEYLLPPAWKEARNIFDYKIKKKQQNRLTKQNGIWIKADNGTIWNIGFLNTKNEQLSDVLIVSFSDKRNRFASIIGAKTAYRKNDQWIFENGFERTFSDDGNFTEKKFKAKDISSSIEIDELKEAEKVPQEMNFKEIYKYVQAIRKAGYDDTRYTVDMYMKILFPLVCLVMAFIAIPFSIKTHRAAGTLLGVTVGVFLGFIFWFFQSMGVSLGQSGKVAPLMATMMPHIIFTSYAIYMTSREYGTIHYKLLRLFKKLRR